MDLTWQRKLLTRFNCFCMVIMRIASLTQRMIYEWFEEEMIRDKQKSKEDRKNWTPEQREAYNKKERKKARIKRANMTPEQHEAEKKRQREKYRLRNLEKTS